MYHEYSLSTKRDSNIYCAKRNANHPFLSHSTKDAKKGKHAKRLPLWEATVKVATPMPSKEVPTFLE